MRRVLTMAVAACAALSLAACGRDSDDDRATETQAAPNTVEVAPAEPQNAVAPAPRKPPELAVTSAGTEANAVDLQTAEDAAASGMTARSTSTTTQTTTTTTTQPAPPPQ